MESTAFSHRPHPSSAYLHANPPSLYDTSTSTGAESWSTGSAGGHLSSRQQPQQPQPQSPYPPHYFPKTRPQQQYTTPQPAQSPQQHLLYSPRSPSVVSVASSGAPYLSDRPTTPSRRSYSSRASSVGEYESNHHSSHGRLSMEPSTFRSASKYGGYSSASARDRANHSSHGRLGMEQPSTFSSPKNIHVRAPSPSPSREFNNNSTSHPRPQNFHEQPRPTTTRSEPGAPNADHDRFAAYVNRFDVLEQRRKGAESSQSPPRQSKNLSSAERSVDSGKVSDRIRKYNNRYPEPEPQLVPSDDDLLHRSSSSSSYGKEPTNFRQSSSNEERQASSPLVPSEEDLYQQHLQHQPRRSRADYKTGNVKQMQQRAERPTMRQAPKRGTSLPPNRSHSYEMESVHPSTPKSQAPDMERFSQSVPNFGENIERPSRASVQELKRQLWDTDETLQVSVRPTLHYEETTSSASYSDRRKTYYGYQAPEMAGKHGHRNSRSLSPGRRSVGSQEAEQKFNSKYYEAAIAARLRGKVHPDEMSHGDQSSKHRRREASVERRRHRDTSSERRGRDSSVEPRRNSRGMSVERRGKEQRSHRDASVERRGRESPLERRLNAREASIERSRAREASVERRKLKRVPSVERPKGVRESSVERRREERESSKRAASFEKRNGARESSVERRRVGRESSSKRAPSVERRERNMSVERRRDASQERRPPRGDSTPTASSKRQSKSSTRSSTGGGGNSQGSGSGPASMSRSASWHVSSVKPRKHDWNDKSPQFELAKQGSGRNISKLVAKLNAVSRNDPKEALAQIDSILKAESRSSSVEGGPEKSQRISLGDSHERITTPLDDQEHTEDDHSDDETTAVSSITNPTYSSASAAKDRPPAKVSDPFDATNVAAVNTAFGPNPTNPFGDGPSTAAFRRPRPSKLQSYAPANAFPPTSDPFFVDQKKKRNPVAGSTPPSTIKMTDNMPKVSKLDGTASAESPSPSPTPEELNSTLAIPPEPASPYPNHGAPLAPEQTEQSEKPESGTTSKLDAFMTNSSALAEQIRVWDELSAGLPKSKSADSGKNQEKTNMEPAQGWEEEIPLAEPTKVAPPAVESSKNEAPRSISKSPIPVLPAPPQSRSSRRGHPWDSSIPIRHETVNARNTSMEGGDGIEMLIERRNELSFTGFDGYDAVSIPGSEAGPQPPMESNDSRRSDLRTSNSSGQQPPMESNDSRRSDRRTSISSAPPSSNEIFDNSFGSGADSAPPSKAPVAGGWEVAPRMTPRQQENAQQISADFDAAWVALPAASFFPDFMPSTPPTREFPKDDPATILAKREQALVGSSRPVGSNFASTLKTPPRRRGTGPVDLDDSFQQQRRTGPVDLGDSLKQKRGTGPVDLDDSFSQYSGQHTHTLAKPIANPKPSTAQLMRDFGAMQDFKPADEVVEPGTIEVSYVDRSPGGKSWATGSPARKADVKEAAEMTPKRKGGFLSRAFGRKDKKRGGSAAAASSSLAPNAPEQSNATTVAGTKREAPILPMLPVPQFDEAEMAPPRGRKGDRTPSTRGRGRSRSSSLERVRSSSIAEKFSRVMRLYDNEI